jgi:hypothetical protein
MNSEITHKHNANTLESVVPPVNSISIGGKDFYIIDTRPKKKLIAEEPPISVYFDPFHVNQVSKF